MNIQLSTPEYRDLLDILHIADVIMSGHRTETDARTVGHRTLIQKLYALARGEGFDQLIGQNESMKKYVPTEAFEHDSLAHGIIHEFGEHLFWDGLVSRLTMRDAVMIAGGNEHLASMSYSEREAMLGPLRQRYIREFSANGVANLSVIEQFGLGEGIPVRTSD
jgi:hypothetical protein